MSRTRYVKGDMSFKTGGVHKIYAKEGYEINSGGFIDYFAESYTHDDPEDAPVSKFEKEKAVFYETDGHYSTVYLVCLMLGMKEADAEELAIAAEAPDTTIHSEMDFELNDTWSSPDYQGPVHSLTGGFHGIEEFMTAVKFLWLGESDPDFFNSKEDVHKKHIKKLGELLHRFGDTYAHSKLDNIKPKELGTYDLYNSSDKNLSLAIKSWKGQGGKSLAKDVEPWIKFINFYTKKYGYDFLNNQDYQREAFKGKTLAEELREIYLVKPTDKFKMYGGGYFTTDHLFADDSYPDMIYIRPDWYLNYVKNLAWLLSLKFELDLNKFDTIIFEKMTKFAIDNTCSLKGIIDYEIAKQRGKKEFYIPVFYSSPSRILASVDAIKSNYLKSAKDAKELTIKYMMYDGNYPTPLEGEEITNLLNVKFNRHDDFFYYTDAYKLKF